VGFALGRLYLLSEIDPDLSARVFDGSRNFSSGARCFETLCLHGRMSVAGRLTSLQVFHSFGFSNLVRSSSTHATSAPSVFVSTLRNPKIAPAQGWRRC
jgi:hypothetical protein